MGRVSQDAPDGPTPLLELVLAADGERASLLAEAETATDPTRIAEIHERLAVIQAHSAPARAAAILAGLGFDAEAQRRPVGSFSGGWRMRVALAATLFAEPDLLLLDEPTNHLDLEAALWLESWLKTYPRTLILVSHDRDVLNTVVGGVLHLERGKLTLYAGDYDSFERTRRERLERQAAVQARQATEARRIRAFVDRFRAKASKARQAQSRLKMLQRMAPLMPIVEERTIPLHFPEPEPLSPPILVLDGAAVGYEPDRPVLSHLDLRIDMDDRIALLGANGNGKSTFVRLLAGRLAPLSGKVRRSPKLRVGYFSQDQADELDLTATPLDHMAGADPLAPRQKHRAHLGRFGFGQDKAGIAVGALSGGEKARLLLALVSRQAPHILLLDEPTNHLDIEAREELVRALNEFAGAVVLISHDAHLIGLVADRLWLVAGGTCAPFDGDLDDYRRMLVDARRAAANGKARPPASRAATVDRKRVRRDAAAARNALSPLRADIKRTEALIATLAGEKAGLEAHLADPTLYRGPPDAIAETQTKLSVTARRLAEAEALWLDQQGALERANSE
jgi:ATP-binding cassette subfamily F protein 3